MIGFHNQTQRKDYQPLRETSHDFQKINFTLTAQLQFLGQLKLVLCGTWIILGISVLQIIPMRM